MALRESVIGSDPHYWAAIEEPGVWLPVTEQQQLALGSTVAEGGRLSAEGTQVGRPPLAPQDRAGDERCSLFGALFPSPGPACPRGSLHHPRSTP